MRKYCGRVSGVTVMSYLAIVVWRIVPLSPPVAPQSSHWDPSPSPEIEDPHGRLPPMPRKALLSRPQWWVFFRLHARAASTPAGRSGEEVYSPRTFRRLRCPHPRHPLPPLRRVRSRIPGCTTDSLSFITHEKLQTEAALASPTLWMILHVPDNMSVSCQTSKITEVTSKTSSVQHGDVPGSVHLDISMFSTAIQELCESTTRDNQLPKTHVTLRIYVEDTHCDRTSWRGRTSWRMPFPLGAARMSCLFFARRSTTASTSSASSPSLASVSRLDGGDRGRFFDFACAFGILTRLRGHPTKASPCFGWGQEHYTKNLAG